MTEGWWGGEQINDWTKAPFDEVLDEEAGTTGWHTANDSHCSRAIFPASEVSREASESSKRALLEDSKEL